LRDEAGSRVSPEVRKLLERLVDRLDAAEQRGSGKAQSVPLDNRLWPELVNAPLESDKEAVWKEARNLHDRKWIRLAPESAAKSPYGYAQSVRVSIVDPVAIRHAVGRLERVRSSAELWRNAVDAHLLGSSETKQVVATFQVEVPGYETTEVVQRLNLLNDLAGQSLLLREVSAKLFWGMSKILDGRQALVAAVLGLPDCPFPESPIQLLVQLPANELRGVLFIENLMSFEQASRSRSKHLDNLALVFASGYRGSAQRLRTPLGASVYYSPRGAVAPDRLDAFEAWLFSASNDLQVLFWGDLDWSGMGILRAMQTPFPGLQAWEEGYAPMLESLLAGNGHLPSAADKQGQLSIGSTGCVYADEQLLPALRSTGAFVDQEVFTL
jgi:hypothetical protein